MTSIVDKILEKHGFEWSVNPYAILDKATGKAVWTGPHFDLTEATLVAGRKALDRQTGAYYSKKVS